MKAPIVYWDEDLGISQYVITDSDRTVHVGAAKCSPKDQDMKSEKTGATIAEMRAKIAYLKYERNNKIKPELKALKKFWNTINKSKYYDANSYPVQMLLRSIQRCENDLIYNKDEVNALKENLHAYIEQKGIFYKKVREMRDINKQAENK